MNPDLKSRLAAAGAALSFAGAFAYGVQAVRMHLWVMSLGPICGLNHPSLLHCAACPAALGLMAAAVVLAATAGLSRASGRRLQLARASCEGDRAGKV